MLCGKACIQVLTLTAESSFPVMQMLEGSGHSPGGCAPCQPGRQQSRPRQLCSMPAWKAAVMAQVALLPASLGGSGHGPGSCAPTLLGGLD